MIWRHTIEALLQPLCLALILFALALFFLCVKGDSTGLRLSFLVIFLLLLLPSLGFLPSRMIDSLQSQYPAVETPDPNIHWVVVLSGGQAALDSKNGQTPLFSATIRRLLEGIRLYRQLPKAKLLLSGGSFAETTSEAQHMALLAVSLGIPKSDIIVEGHSLNTAAQALEIKKIIADAPFYLVSSATHLPRSMKLFKKQQMKPLAAACDFVLYWKDERWQKYYFPNARNLVYFNQAMHEYLGMIWAGWRGRL